MMSFLLSCTPSISTVSEINPFIGNDKVEITGIFCTTDSSGIYVLFSVDKEVMGCYDIEINSNGTSLICNYSNGATSTNESTFNFNKFYSVLITGLLAPVSLTRYENNNNDNFAITPQPSVGIPNYLYSNSGCPKGCTNNGVCNFGNTCSCNQGYAGFDCSFKVYQTLNSPTLPNGDNVITFKNSNNNFNIDFEMSHVLATSTKGNILSTKQQVLLSSMPYNTRYINPFDTTTYSYMGSNSNSWLTNFGYNIGDSANDESSSFINYKGSYLPKSPSFASISLNSTINSQFASLPFNIFNTTNGNGSFAIIFEISTSTTAAASLTTTTSDSLNSIVIQGNGLTLTVTISDLYDFNGNRVPSHATLQVVPSSNAKQILQDYSPSSLYISLNFDQQSILYGNTTSLSGSYTHQLIINSYNNIGSSNNDDNGLQKWKIALIVIGCLLGFILIIGLIIFVVRKRHHHHHHGSYKFNDERTPLYK